MARPSLESLLGGSKPTQRPSLESFLGAKKNVQTNLSQDRSFALEQAGLNPSAIEKAYGSQVSDMPAKDFQNFVSELGGIKQSGAEREQKLADKEQGLGRARALGQGASFGLADEIEALAKGGISEYGKEKEKINTEQAEYTKAHPIESIAFDVGGGLVSGAGVAKGLDLARKASLLGKVGQGVKIGAIAGGVEGATRGEGSEGRVKGAKIGATLGAAAGGIVPLAGAGIKAARPAKRIVAEKVDDVMRATKSGKFEDIVVSNKGKVALNNAIKSGDEDIAVQIQNTADKHIFQTPQRIENKIDGVISFDNIAKKSQSLKDDFGNFMQKRGGEQIKSKKLSDVLQTKSFKKAYEDVMGENVALRNKPVNSVEVLQEVKSTLGNWARTGDKGANKFGKRSGEIKDIIDSNFSGFKDLNIKYAKMKNLDDTVDKLTTLKSGKTPKDLFFDKQVKDSITDNFGKDKYNKVFDTLKTEKRFQDRLGKLSTRAEAETTKADPLLGERMREAFESIGSAAGSAVDAGTVSRGRHIRKSVADVLLGNQKYTPAKKIIKRPQDLTTALIVGTQPLQEAK